MSNRSRFNKVPEAGDPIIAVDDDQSVTSSTKAEAPSSSDIDIIDESSNESKSQVKINDEKSDDSDIEDFVLPERTLPPYNVCEKIIIVYDSAQDETTVGFKVNGENLSPHDMIKRGLKFFLQNKHNIDPKHEYALAVMNESNILWQVDFTNNIEKILKGLEDTEICETEDIIKLDRLFELIREKVDIKQHYKNIPPNYIVRCLLIYGRSFTIPQLNRNEITKAILEAPYFTLDVLMTHEIPNSQNNCIKIFKFLQSLDNKGFAYFFPVGRNALDLHVAMAKLLGHPLQRPCQKIANYKINIPNH